MIGNIGDIGLDLTRLVIKQSNSPTLYLYFEVAKMVEKLALEAEK